ncbi:hypothetical protein E1258_25330 [Micromonospora sp. KC207]|uniref:hypothetical protein n=1 Tax=Micromonospora sp. KC207 TaxID=2530377 RepID=UPI00104F5E31|nr:hypothetical protein [Micromonospora sp. KC207]TDC52097.1 hypothetical protein E1258_25330 [Micromonospora sp. KC207]
MFAAEARPAEGRRARILVAPVTVTPTKPLTPSHLKGLLWTDVLVRATAALADVTHLGSHTAFHSCEQTVGFWEFLDRTFGDLDYSACSDEDIGELYVRYRRSGQTPTAAACRPYLEALDEHSWVHPASARVLDIWQDQYAQLGMADPGLTRHQPPGLALEETIARLDAEGLCVDLRRLGGPVYLDPTRWGMPLRRIVAADGRPNYLACALRQLLPLVPDYDETVLLCDRELQPDYVLLQRVLTKAGATVHRVTLGRVAIDGQIDSARHGGWHRHTAAALLRAAGAGYDEAALRFGLRLYFIAVLGPGTSVPFSFDLLHRSLRRARLLLTDDGGATGTDLADLVGRHRGRHRYVDPYRLTSGLLARRQRRPGRELIRTVFA